jgi:starch phosphorylase
MRLLVDEHGLRWSDAWSITRQTFAYTNHTLLPEALEQWPLALFGRILPRHLEIVLEINAQFLDEARLRFLGEEARIARLSLINEHGERYVRMANLACVGSHAINGVAELHSELLKQDVLHDFHALWPDKFSNKTNGITPRRWLMLANPRLSRLITVVDRARLDPRPRAAAGAGARRRRRGFAVLRGATSSTPTKSRSRATCSRSSA